MAVESLGSLMRTIFPIISQMAMFLFVSVTSYEKMSVCVCVGGGDYVFVLHL